jgi:L-iditol 2-dehydrogenase
MESARGRSRRQAREGSMKALVLTAYRRLEIQDLPEPVPGPRDVRVRVRACGICGSDVHGYDGSSGRRIPPIVMGHEAAGVVDAVGAEVKSLQPGDRVTFDSTVHCGECAYCRSGQVNLCDRRRVMGVSPGDYRQDGAFAEAVVVPERIVCRVPDAVPLEHAAMVEPLSVAVHAVRRAKVTKGDRALVVGCGMIGLLTLQAAKAAGCASVVAVDVDDERLVRARRLGADVTLGGGDDVAAGVNELTGGRGVDVAFEAVGAPAPIATAVGSLRKGGTLVLIGNVTPRVEVDLQAIVTRELSLLGTCASSGEYETALELLARGAVRLDGLISKVAPLEEGPAWFERLYAREPGLMKVILQP